MKNKICTSCNQEKEISNFSKHQTGKFGVRSSCKNCEKLYQTKNKDKIQKYHKNWYKENKEVQLDSCHKRYQEKREVILNQCKDYYQSHKENIKMYPSSNPKQKKDRYLQRVYGITLEQYTKILKSQNGVCSICSQKEISKSRQGKIKQLSVDHNHQTGKVRGLLCHRCNRVLGHVKDDSKILNLAINYLNIHRG